MTAPNTPAIGNLITNDSDDDGDILMVVDAMVDIDGDGVLDTLPIGTATPITDAAGDPIGTMTLNSDGSFTFEPATAYDGPVPTTTYTISDGTDTATAELSFADVPNTPPVAVDDGAIITESNTPVSGNVLDNDSDPDGDEFMVTEFTVAGITATAGTPVIIPEVGTILIDANGDFTFIPDTTFSGPVPVTTYTISDGTDTATGELTFAPVPNAGVDVNQLLNESSAGPVQTPSVSSPSSRTTNSSGLTAPKIILDTVSNIADLGTLGSIDSASPILSAVNGFGDLQSIDEGVFESTSDRNADNVFSPNANEVEINMGDSSTAQGNVGASSSGSFGINTFIRDGQLFVSALSADATSNVEYSATLGDGRALPNWVSVDQTGTILIDPPAGVEAITLKIIQIDANGNATSRTIEVNTLNSQFQDVDQTQRTTASFTQGIGQTIACNQSGQLELNQIIQSSGSSNA